jgi:hypothetical protein
VCGGAVGCWRVFILDLADAAAIGCCGMVFVELPDEVSALLI